MCSTAAAHDAEASHRGQRGIRRTRQAEKPKRPAATAASRSANADDPKAPATPRTNSAKNVTANIVVPTRLRVRGDEAANSAARPPLVKLASVTTAVRTTRPANHRLPNTSITAPATIGARTSTTVRPALRGVSRTVERYPARRQGFRRCPARVRPLATLHCATRSTMMAQGAEVLDHRPKFRRCRAGDAYGPACPTARTWRVRALP